MSAGAPPSRLYRPPVPRFWWLRRRSYLVFVLRELTSVFVAWFVVFLLLMIDAVHAGGAAYQQFLDWSARPWVLALNVVALAFLLLHSITWFNLAPQAIVVKMRGERVPPRPIALAHFAAWAFATAVVAWFLVGRS